MSTLIRFPLERTRVPTQIEVDAEAPAWGFHELMTYAKTMGGWIHYCKAREYQRVIVKAGHACAVCGDCP